MNLFPLFDYTDHFAPVLLNSNNGGQNHYEFCYKKASSSSGFPGMFSDCPVISAKNILLDISHTYYHVWVHNKIVFGEEISWASPSNKSQQYPILTCELNEEKNLVKIYFNEHPSLWVWVPVKKTECVN
jgi:hypothetical protein